MLSIEGMWQREWGEWPTLGRLLGGAELPSEFVPITSISETPFEEFERVLRLSVLVTANSKLLRKAVKGPNGSDVWRDLNHLSEQLQLLGEMVIRQSRAVSTLRRAVRSTLDR